MIIYWIMTHIKNIFYYQDRKYKRGDISSHFFTFEKLHWLYLFIHGKKLTDNKNAVYKNSFVFKLFMVEMQFGAVVHIFGYFRLRGAHMVFVLINK